MDGHDPKCATFRALPPNHVASALYALNLGPRAAERAISTLVDFGLVERLARPASGRQATYRLRVAERYDAMQSAVERREMGMEGAR